MSAAERFARCIAAGGVALFPADTVYGLACDPENPAAVERLYRIKGRPARKPAAVMFFGLEAALEALPDLGPRTAAALRRLLPGPVTAVLANPTRRFPLACSDDPEALGLRVPRLPVLATVRRPVLQSSANPAGAPDARRLEDIPAAIRDAADEIIDGGELPGVASTVVDLRRYEDGGIDAVQILRPGAVTEAEIAAALDHQFHFNPQTYGAMLRADFPEFDAFQDAVAKASSDPAVRTILELGTGTGETARRLLAAHPAASLIGIDESPEMLAAARALLPARRAELRVQRLQDRLPDGPFDLVASALCVHHLDDAEKPELFTRVREVLAPDGRFVLGDVVVPEDPSEPCCPLTPGYDKPSTVADQMRWLGGAGFEAGVTWRLRDVVVIVAAARA